MKKIRIIIPTYNRFEKLSELIDRISCISDYVSEVLILDNCSEDDTSLFAAKTSKNLNISYARNQANIGLRGNLKKAYESAVAEINSDFVWVMSDDDKISVAALNLIVDLLQSASNEIYFINHSTEKNGRTSRKSAIKKTTDQYRTLRDIFRIDGPQFMLLGSLIYSTKIFNGVTGELNSLIACGEITLPLRFGMYFAEVRIYIVDRPGEYINDQSEISWESEGGLVYKKYIPKDLIYLYSKRSSFKYLFDLIVYAAGKVSAKIAR